MKRKINLRTLIIVGVVINLLVVLYSQQKLLDQNIEKKKALEKKLSAQIELNQELVMEEESIGTEEFIEKHARKLGFVKKDEIVFVYDK